MPDRDNTKGLGQWARAAAGDDTPDPKDADQTASPFGENVVAFVPLSMGNLLRDLQRGFANLHRCNNLHKCLNADLLDGQHYTDIQDWVTTQIAASVVTEHNDLGGLTTGDPHTQYLPVDGTRPMLGALDLVNSTDTGVPTLKTQEDADTGIQIDGTNKEVVIIIDGTEELKVAADKVTIPGLLDPSGLELTPQSSNPGSDATNTYFIDSGSGSYDAGTHVFGDSDAKAVFPGGAATGEADTEQNTIKYNSNDYTVADMTGDKSDTYDATRHDHKHSTLNTLLGGPIHWFSRSNSTGNSHGAPTSGQFLGTLLFGGHSGNAGVGYLGGAQVSARATGTFSASNAQAKLEISVTGSGATAPTLAVTVHDDKRVELENALVLNENATTFSPSAGEGYINLVNNAPNTLEFTDDGSGEVYIGVRHNLVRAYGENPQNLTNAVWTKVQLDVEDFDLESVFDSSTNYRFTPNVAGYYQINWNVEFALWDPEPELEENPIYDNRQGFSCKSAIYKNGSKYAGGSTDTFNGLNLTPPGVDESEEWPESHGSDIVYLNGENDYIELYAWGYIDPGTAYQPRVRSGETRTYLSATLINKK